MELLEHAFYQVIKVPLDSLSVRDTQVGLA